MTADMWMALATLLVGLMLTGFSVAYTIGRKVERIDGKIDLNAAKAEERYSYVQHELKEISRHNERQNGTMGQHGHRLSKLEGRASRDD